MIQPNSRNSNWIINRTPKSTSKSVPVISFVLSEFTVTNSEIKTDNPIPCARVIIGRVVNIGITNHPQNLEMRRPPRIIPIINRTNPNTNLPNFAIRDLDYSLIVYFLQVHSRYVSRCYTHMKGQIRNTYTIFVS